MKKTSRIIWLLALLFSACDEDEAVPEALRLLEAFVGTVELNPQGEIAEGLPVDRSITLVFSAAVDRQSAVRAITLQHDQQKVSLNFTFLSDDQTVVIYPAGTLQTNSVYALRLSGELTGQNGEKFSALEISFKTTLAEITVTAVEAGGQDYSGMTKWLDVPLDLSVTIYFSEGVDRESVMTSTTLSGPGQTPLSFNFADDNTAVTVTSDLPLRHLSKYGLNISSQLKGAEGQPFQSFSAALYTEADDTPKFPLLSDEELLTLVQQRTFRYFYDFAHPASGMARERNTSGNTVTSGGSGFGIMALIVGMERNFITRESGLEHMDKILSFLETADRFHGAWPHWMNGNTGDVIPFSANDNGGDLVETSFLIQGLLAFRQYLNAGNAEEKVLIDRINVLWQAVDWDWYTRGQNVLYWHWSPDKQWAMNLPVRGYNEALITYLLAASSPTHPVDAAVYHEGWARSGAIVNGKTFYGHTLPLGYDYGGPLFFAHYSFLGLDPRGLTDTYANYWTQNVNHSLINHAYSADNPKNFAGYSDESWGLTASDSPDGYSAHSPTNDLGVITPTAALSSLPYTPEESMKALKFFYYTLGDRLWGPYGFYDAFSIEEGWTADSYLAIDQGPIVVMIENYRSGLLWDLFMSAPEVQDGLVRLGFTR